MKRLLHMNSEKISQEVQLPVWELHLFYYTLKIESQPFHNIKRDTLKLRTRFRVPLSCVFWGYQTVRGLFC